jgi:hypothetical protein
MRSQFEESAFRDEEVERAVFPQGARTRADGLEAPSAESGEMPDFRGLAGRPYLRNCRTRFR